LLKFYWKIYFSFFASFILLWNIPDFFPLFRCMDFSIIYYIKSSIVGIFSIIPMHSIILVSIIPVFYCIVLSSTVEFVRPIRAILYSVTPLGVLDAGGGGLASELCSLARPSCCWIDVIWTPHFIHPLPAVSDAIATVGNGMTGAVSTSEITGFFCQINKTT